MLGIVGGIADITENVLPACLGTGWSGMPKLPSPKTQIVFIRFALFIFLNPYVLEDQQLIAWKPRDIYVLLALGPW